jgi:hypothetical protein
MTVTPRSKLLLAVLGVLLVFLLVRSFGSDQPPAPRPARFVPTEDLAEATAPAAPPAPSGVRPRAAAKREAEQPREVTALRAADLEIVPPAFTPGRDPWRFVDPPPPPPPPPPPGPTPEQLRAMAEAQARALEAQREAARKAAEEAALPRPAEFTMEYLGNFGPKERKIAVFSDGQDVHNAREGEVIDQKFIVAHIGLESVDIEFVGFPDWPAQRLAVRSR